MELSSSFECSYIYHEVEQVCRRGKHNSTAKTWLQWQADLNPRNDFLASVMGNGFTQSNPSVDPVKELYEAMEFQMRSKGMFTPVFNDHPRVRDWVGEYDSWKRMYPPQSAWRKGGTINIPSEFMHLAHGDQQLLCNLIASKDEEAYRCAEAVGSEAWKQGLRR